MLALNLMKDPCIKHNASPSCLENSDPQIPLWGPLSRRHFPPSPSVTGFSPNLAMLKFSVFLSTSKTFSHPPHPFFLTSRSPTPLSLACHYCTDYIIIDYIIPLYPDDMFMIYRSSMQMTFVFAPNTYCDHFCSLWGLPRHFRGPIYSGHTFLPSTHWLQIFDHTLITCYITRFTDIWSHIDYMLHNSIPYMHLQRGATLFLNTSTSFTKNILHFSQGSPPIRFHYIIMSCLV